MPRLKREDSRALTSQRLVEAASFLFGRDGYATTSVERIAETAGFSKGAVYSNFDNKEAIFLAVLDRHGTMGLDGVISDIVAAASPAAVVELLVRWADEQSRSGNWSLTILEHARLAGAGSPSVKRQEEIIRRHWLRLGEAVLLRVPKITKEPELLGALLHEIAHAPAITLMKSPTAGKLMALALELIVS